ncbi:MAG: hypothetical protein GF311_24205 [Candidatus Lokiarchaeota archaeon]|nr:hypothetical protein [Candidatus Lokiarchaeota archaeon]
MLNLMKQRIEMIENYKKYLKKIHNDTQSVLECSNVDVFGSLIRDELVVASDIDILIITEVPQNQYITRRNHSKDRRRSWSTFISFVP